MAERERCAAYGCTVWRCLVNTWGNHSVDNVCVCVCGGGGDVQHTDVLFGGVLYIGVCIYVGMS